MSEWTAERLAGLHEGTVVSYATEATSWFVVKGKDDAWFYVLLGRVRTSAQILDLADPGSVRVVSVPVDALMSDETMPAAFNGLHSAGLAFPANEFNELTCEECGYAWRWPGISEAEQRVRWETHRMHHAIRAAIAHVTGDNES